MIKVKNIQGVLSLLLEAAFFLGIASALSTLPLYGVSGIYDRIGIIPEHGFHGAVPEENIDLFTGNLTLRFQDIRLPGPNGFDTVVWRVYNSKVLKDRLPGGAWGMQQDPYSWVGMGWSMHMGIVHNYLSTEPVIEFPDGRFETAYPNNTDSYYYTRDFLKYDKTNYKLYFKDGTVWTFGLSKTIVIQGISESVRVVTLIENSYGHTISVTYQSGSLPEMKSITDSLGRTINFILTGDRLDKISVKNSTGTTVYYDYTVGTFSNSGYYKLTGYDPPEIAASTYEYDTGLYDRYELTAVNTSYGGRMEYSYVNHTFYFYVQSLDTRVVSQKKMRTGAAAAFNTWTYTYPSYLNTAAGTVTVDGPVYDTNVTYHAYSSASPWKIGLMSKKSFSDGSYSEETLWTYREISFHTWLVLNANLGTIKAPLIQKSIVTRLGDAESTEEFLYERDAVKKYGFPTKINYYGGIDGTTLMNYKTLAYNFESDSNYVAKYLLSYVKNESLYSGAAVKLKETKTTYYSTAGKYGAIDKIERWKEGSVYLAWDYTYTSTAPNSITITIDLPGTAGTETYVYSYGVLSQLKRPGYTELTRTISSYTGDITGETNQHGGVMGFTYDSLGRIKTIDMPTGFNDITAVWAVNSVTITQGSNTVTKYWDGLARDLGYKESGDGTTLYFFKTLDAEGRVTGESKGGGSSAYKYLYQRNAAGNPTSITDPMGKITAIAYLDDDKTVTDAETHATVFSYYGLPGLATQVKDALAKTVKYTYDGAGRLTSVDFNNAARPLMYYNYNGLDQATSETHPETGSIAYTYDSQGNLSTKTWGGVTYSYSYNTSNQLTQSASGDETITYTYDTSGRVSVLSSTKSWKRDLITYNKLGSITGERQTIPVLGIKSTAYGYDVNNNLKSVTYPDGKIGSMTNNGLNMPETVSFNAKTLVSASAYGSLKQPTAMTIAGNGTAFSASYNNNGALSAASLKKETITHYSAAYGYDNVGNIKTLTGTVPALNAAFGYDALYRLYSAVYTGGKSYAYTYDDYGNLTVAKENNISVFSTLYNSKNQPTNTNYVYDSRGNMTAAPGFLYVWSRDNYLASVKDKLGTVITGNDYNERGLRYHARRAVPPTIVVTSPNGGQSYQVGAAVAITWNSQGVVGNVKIDYSINNGSTWTAIIASTANDGSHTWTIPNTPSSTCRVRVSEIDGSPFDQSDAAFTILTPNIKVVSPNGGESWEVASIHNITWTSGGVVGNVKIDYSTNNGSTWISIITSTANDGAHTWTVPNTLSTTCRVRVSELDSSPYDISNASFSIIKKPTVMITFPNGGEKLEVGSRQAITWTRAEADAVGAVTVEYTADNGVTWNVIVSSYVDSENYTWTVPDNVSSGCRVRVRVSKSGNRIAGLDSYESDESNDVFSIVDPAGITVISPNGDEIIPPGKNFTISWLSGSAVDIENVKLEYSPDNGTTYLPIAERVPNTGSYEWAVPYHLSAHCLVRISAADESNEKQPGFDLLYEFKFKLNEIELGISNATRAGNDFTIRLGDVENETIQNFIPSISFNGEANGKEYISFEGTSVELGACKDFHQSWHTIQIMLENGNEKVSITFDGKPMLENIPLSPMVRFSPVVSFVGGSGAEVSIDDFSVKIHSTQEKEEKEWNVLFNEDFERFIDGAQLKDSGWNQKLVEIKEKAAESASETDNVSILQESSNAGQSVKIQSNGEHEAVIVKSFKVPHSFPFDVSDKPFEIRYNDDMNRSMNPISTGNERAEAYSSEIDYNAHGPYCPPDMTWAYTTNNLGQIQAVTVTYTDTYYIYSFDGKLLSEYDQTGSCVRDYIYIGNRLLAEYRPSTGKYYYYMSDQINSTRIITDDLGNVVYSEAYGPYGDVQKTWTKTYDPKQKFSGKEREGYSELDYFGARYFDNNSYRFISVDPIINKEGAIANPQLWNLYAYCRNNPITFSDPDGRKYEIAGSKTFEAQINQMIGYLNQSRIASKIIKRLKNAKDTIKITETKILDNTSFSRSDKTIVINPKEGIRIDNGIIQSPALGLLHEMAHASRYLEDPKGYANDLTIDLKSSGFKDMEEFRVITFIEAPAAKQIPGEPGRDTQLENGRNRYPGVIVQGPCSRTEQR